MDMAPRERDRGGGARRGRTVTAVHEGVQDLRPDLVGQALGGRSLAGEAACRGPSCPPCGSFEVCEEVRGPRMLPATDQEVDERIADGEARRGEGASARV